MMNSPRSESPPEERSAAGLDGFPARAAHPVSAIDPNAAAAPKNPRLLISMSLFIELLPYFALRQLLVLKPSAVSTADRNNASGTTAADNAMIQDIKRRSEVAIGIHFCRTDRSCAGKNTRRNSK